MKMLLDGQTDRSSVSYFSIAFELEVELGELALLKLFKASEGCTEFCNL